MFGAPEDVRTARRLDMTTDTTAFLDDLDREMERAGKPAVFGSRRDRRDHSLLASVRAPGDVDDASTSYTLRRQ
jgi:hypothetical protein